MIPATVTERQEASLQQRMVPRRELEPRVICNWKDEATRRAIIALGWTPPFDHNP